MNETTKAIRNLLLDHNPTEMSVTFANCELAEFPDKIREYVENVILPEIDYQKIADFFAEMPFRE